MIREKLLEIIAGALPETRQNEEFCGSDSFILMLDRCMEAIKYDIESVMEEEG